MSDGSCLTTLCTQYRDIYFFLTENPQIKLVIEEKIKTLPVKKAFNSLFGYVFPEDESSIKESWTRYMISNLKSFYKVSQNDMVQLYNRAKELGYHISYQTIYPACFGGTARRVILTDNYMFLVKKLCEKVNATNIFVELLTNKEIAAIGDRLFTKKIDLLAPSQWEHDPSVDDIAAVAVSCVHDHVLSQTKLFSKERLNRRSQFKYRPQLKVDKQHMEVEMLKKTALRLYAKELGIGIIGDIDRVVDQLVDP